MSKPLKAFISYSHEDKDDQKRKKLRTRLAVMERNGEIKARDDTDIAAGGKARQEDILKEVANSDILLYLVSADSLASENCNKELTEAVRAEKRVIPIILESCDWLNHQLSDFQALPDKGKPINKWDDESDGWQNVVDGIREAVEEMQAQADTPSGISEKELRAELAFQHGNVLMMIGQINSAIEHYSHAITLNPDNADAYNNRGIAYNIKGDSDQAIPDYTKAIELKPYYAAAYTNRGAAYSNRGEFDRAIADHTKAIELKPDYAAAYTNRGTTYRNKGEFDLAVADHTKAIELKPDYAAAYTNRGAAYSNRGEFDRAIVDCNTAIRFNPNYAEAYNNRGIIYSIKGHFDRAITDYSAAVRLNPNYAEAYNNRGVTYERKGEFDRAIVDCNTAIRFNPDYAEAYNNRGNAYDRKGEYGHAIANHTKAIELKPDFAAAYTNRGNAYDRKGEYDLAIGDYSKAIELKPDYAEAYTNRGITYSNKGEFDRAIANHTKAIDLKPDFAAAYTNRGNAYDRKGEYDLAIEDYSKAIKLNPALALVFSNRGSTYCKKGCFTQAIKDLTKAIKLSPNCADAYFNRGNIYRDKGEVDQSIASYTAAIELKPDYADAYFNRGNAYLSKRDYGGAAEDYTMALRLNPKFGDAYANRGFAYRMLGRLDLAIEDYNRAIKLYPSDADVYNNRGVAYLNKREFDHALQDFNTAIQLKPDLVSVYVNRGLAYFSKNEVNQAIEDYTTAIGLNPELAPAYYNRGLARLYLREWERAKSDLTTARNMGVDIIAVFHNDYKSVEAYERANRVKLPEDIALMLTQRRRSRFPKTEKFLSADGTPLESPDVLNLLAKLRNSGPPLSQYVQARPAFGIKTGASGAFVVNSATRDQLIADHPASADILKPFLHGRDIRRWGVESPDSWLIFTHRRIEIDRYPAIRKHLEQYRSVLSKRAGRQKWYELPTTKRGTERFTQTKLICPNNYNHQTFAVDTDGFYCGDTCYLIPTAETWLCGLLNSHIVEWFYSQTSNQLTIDYLRARSRHIQEIPIPELTPTQKSLIGKIVDYLIYLQGQPTTNSRDLAHARDAVMLGYFERIIDGLAYESYLHEELHQGEKQFFKPLLDERLPQLEEIRGDKMVALREIFERLYERTHPIRRNLFFLNSVKPIRIIEDRT